jgi:multiple sugar transport system substrate-binding protein
MKKLLFLICLPILLAACTPNKPEEKITLNYWGVYEPKENLDEIINEYQAANPNVTIVYTRKTLTDYRQQVTARVGQPNGPDMFRFHNSWVPQMKSILAVTPQSTVDNLQYATTFYPVVQTDLAANRGFYGIPLMYDGLGLYYNKQLFRQRGLLKPPATWREIEQVAKQLKADTNGKLDIGGIALGSTGNIDYWSDIFALLMYQQNASFVAPFSTKQETETAAKFYTDYVGQHKTWSETMTSSTDAFAQGKLAMMFGTSWSAFEIQGKNPNLEFAVAPVPQIPGSKLGLASYWAEGVANNIDIKKQEAAWKFLEHLASKETQQRLYAIQGKTRLFGEPPSRKDLAETVQDNDYINGIMDTADVAKSTYMSDKTFSGGLNEELMSQYKKVVINRELQSSSAQIQTILYKYGIQ